MKNRLIFFLIFTIIMAWGAIQGERAAAEAVEVVFFVR